MMVPFELNRKPFFHLYLLLLLLFCSSTISLKFELQSGHKKCIAENIKKNYLTVGKYSVVNPNDGHPMPDSHKVTVEVASSYGNGYHYGNQIQSGQFSFVAADTGDYITCFKTMDHNPQITLTIEFDWKTGVAAKESSNIMKKGQVDGMQQEIKKLQETVTSIYNDMHDHVRERELELTELNATTTSGVLVMNLLSLFIILSVAGLQVWHLKNFFEKRKLI